MERDSPNGKITRAPCSVTGRGGNCSRSPWWDWSSFSSRRWRGEWRQPSVRSLRRPAAQFRRSAGASPLPGVADWRRPVHRNRAETVPGVERRSPPVLWRVRPDVVVAARTDGRPARTIPWRRQPDDGREGQALRVRRRGQANVMCTHPPREWFRGMLLPCAEPTCGGIGGQVLIVPLTSQGTGMRMKHERATFRRASTLHPDGRRFMWELDSVEDVTKQAEEAHRRMMRDILRSK